jgi:hypothetical protein
VRSELEEPAAPTETLLVCEIGGNRRYVKLGSVDDPVLLRAMLPFVRDVTSRAEIVERLLAPACKGESMVEAIDQEQEFDQFIAADAQAEQAGKRSFFQTDREQRAAEEARQERLTAEQKAAEKRQDRTWKIFSSASRAASARAKLDRWRQEVELPRVRLVAERDRAIRAAVQEVTERISAEYAAAIRQLEDVFADREKR